MKKVKKLLCTALSLTLILSSLPQAIAEEATLAEEATEETAALEATETPFSAEATLNGMTDGSEMRVTAKIVNTGTTDGTVKVYKTVYNKDETLKSTSTESVFVPAGDSVRQTFGISYSEKSGEYASIYLWKLGTNEPVAEMLSSSDCDYGTFERSEIEITENTVFASSEVQSDHKSSAAGDNDTETYWSAKSVSDTNPQSVTAEFDGVYNVTEVGVLFGLGETRSYEFSVEGSVDGEYYDTFIDRTWSEKSTDTLYFETGVARAKYLRITLYGTDDEENTEGWVRVNDIEAYGSAALENTETVSLMDGEWKTRAMTEWNNSSYTPTLGSKLYADIDTEKIFLADYVDRGGVTSNTLSLSSASASQTPENSNSPSNVIDGSTSTYWSAKGVSEDAPAYVIADAGSVKQFDTLKLAFGKGSERHYTFDVYISSDGTTYTELIAKCLSQQTNDLVTYNVGTVSARYIRVTVYGKDTEDADGWIRVTEIQLADSSIEIEGAGGILAGKEYTPTASRGRYNISFDLNFHSATASGDDSSCYWNGFSLTSAFPSGGSDSSTAAAMQLRFEESSGKIKVKKLTSNRFNEGSLADFFSTTFDMDEDINFSLDVDPSKRKIDISITQGDKLAERYIYFNYENDQRTRATTWTGLEAKWLVFNTGASAKSEYEVKNVILTRIYDEESTPTETVVGAPEISEDTVEFTALEDSVSEFTASLGDKLYGEIVEAPEESGISGSAIHLCDEVGRETDSTNGAGGAAAYITLPTPDTKTAYKVEFTMYAPVADDYGGFSLGSGRNYTVGSGDNPLAAQLRFFSSTVDDVTGIKFSAYDSSKLNSGTLSDLVGKYTPIKSGASWKIAVVVNPHSFVINLSIDDGENYQYNKTKSFCGSSSTWASGVKIDTLMINTGIGGAGDIYVGDIKVTDLGSMEFNTATALNGIVRLMATNGTGKYMHHNGDTTVNFAEKQTMNYTRFVERGGLMGEGTVSFEAMNKPGYFVTVMPGSDGEIQLQPYSSSARFRANASFRKEKIGSDSTNVIYSLYRDPNKYLYDNSGSAVAWSMHSYDRICWRVKAETSAVVADDFKDGFKWDEWIPGYSYNQTWSGGVMLSYHNHSGVARSSNIVIEDGECLLKATKDSNAHAGSTYGIDYSNYNFYDENGNHKTWTSFAGYVGVLTARASSGKDYAYSYNKNSLLEGSFKQPAGARGYWTAFWLTGETWPPEIDIFEYMSQYGGSKFFTNIHRSSSSSSSQYGYSSDSSLQTKYHTYALDWGDGFIDYYFDGEFLRRVTGDIATFQNNCQLIINTGLGGWEYEPDSSTLWNTGLRLDWIRTYQQ